MIKNKQVLLEQIKADIIKNNICPNLAEMATNLVMGDGSVDAEIVIIGEAPGKKEDESGLPFMGAAGKFLDEMLASVNINRDSVFITNIVKYRPPKNRDPSADEKLAFWPYLLRQLNVIQPKIVVTLGRHSMGYFLPDKLISEVHGQPEKVEFENLKITVVPLYHPAAALYRRSMREVLIDDFKKLPKIIKNI
jgi:uracil-DNA glycosylase family 4